MNHLSFLRKPRDMGLIICSHIGNYNVWKIMTFIDKNFFLNNKSILGSDKLLKLLSKRKQMLIFLIQKYNFVFSTKAVNDVCMICKYV